MGANIEDTLMIHKNEMVYYDTAENKHYRLNSGNIVKITFDYMEVKKFFGLKKVVMEFIKFDVKDDEIPTSEIIIREDEEPSFHRYLGGIRSFVDDNKIDLEIKRYKAPDPKK